MLEETAKNMYLVQIYLVLVIMYFFVRLESAKCNKTFQSKRTKEAKGPSHEVMALKSVPCLAIQEKYYSTLVRIYVYQTLGIRFHITITDFGFQEVFCGSRQVNI